MVLADSVIMLAVMHLDLKAAPLRRDPKQQEPRTHSRPRLDLQPCEILW